MCLIDVLTRTHERLQQGIHDALVEAARGSGADARLFAVRLRALYDEAACVFGAVRGHTPEIEVAADVEARHVDIRAESGQLRLTWGEQGWTSTLLGLRGGWLAGALAAWPAFHVPLRDEPDVNTALGELRDLFAQPRDPDIARLIEIADEHLSPLIHDYIRRHVAAWDEAPRRAFLAHQQRRFAAYGIKLLTHQTADDLAATLDRFDTADDLASALHPLLEGATRAWRALYEHAPDPRLEPWSDTLTLTFGPWNEELRLYRRRDTWTLDERSGPEAVVEAITEAIFQAPPSPLERLNDELADALDAEDSGDYDLDGWDEQAIEAFLSREYCLHERPDLLLEVEADEGDEGLLDDEEHWTVQSFYQGIERTLVDGDEDEDDELEPLWREARELRSGGWA